MGSKRLQLNSFSHDKSSALVPTRISVNPPPPVAPWVPIGDMMLHTSLSARDTQCHVPRLPFPLGLSPLTTPTATKAVQRRLPIFKTEGYLPGVWSWDALSLEWQKGVLFPFRDSENVLLSNFKFSPGSSTSLFGCPNLLSHPAALISNLLLLFGFLIQSSRPDKESLSFIFSLFPASPSHKFFSPYHYKKKKKSPLLINDWN